MALADARKPYAVIVKTEIVRGTDSELERLQFERRLSVDGHYIGLSCNAKGK